MLNKPMPRGEAEFVETDRSPTEAEARSVEATTRRKHSRFAVDLDVTVTSEHNFYAGFAENMSAGGLFIATHQLKPVGERLEFTVNVPGIDQPIRGVGEVRWLRTYSETSNVPPGMGIKFEKLEPGSLRAIDEFLAQREPLFYDDD
jgi:uncharacterized protein (TIGR02266 family)